MPTRRTSSTTPRRGRNAVATIRDVANRAGVSVATVSRVLNRTGVVKDETSQGVLAAARSLRYVPNVAARSLSIRRSHTIGVVLPDVHGEFFSELIRGIDLAARGEGYHLLVSGSHSDAAEMVEVVEAMRGRVDGLAVMAPGIGVEALDAEVASGFPMVLLNSSDSHHPSILIDNFGGARQVMRHLISLGHERIAFIKGPAHNTDARERLRGYRYSMRGAAGADRIEIAGDFTEQSGHDAVRTILAMNGQPTAIFAANDSMAVGAISALAAAGVAVPGEMSVVGFDDIPIARYIAPPLTTIAVDIAELGRRTFEMLVRAIAERTTEPSREWVATTLVARRSSSRPPANASRAIQKMRDR